MTKLYQPINFPFADELIIATFARTDFLKDGNIFVCNVPIIDSLMNRINSYLAERQISPILNVLAFKRIDTTMKYNNCHVDSRKDGDIHASLIIPVNGCKDTYQYWYTGKYNQSIAMTSDGAEYFKLNWEEEGQFLDEVEIFNTSVLCRVDIPHSARSRHETYRTTVTLRFEANEDFEYLSEHLSM